MTACCGQQRGLLVIRNVVYLSEWQVDSLRKCPAPVWLHVVLDWSLAKATLIAGGLLIALFVVVFVKRNVWLQSPELLIIFTVLITLLVSPYLYNYDFILLLVPFAVLIKHGNLLQKVIVLICYLVPTFAIALLGRAGNISLIAVTIIIAALLYLRTNSKVDVPALAS